jgi:deazaflavin-dependent oxidoreductase (nitroreductase family)
VPEHPVYGELPYSPGVMPLLTPLRRVFLVLNRWYAVPVIRLGLAPLHMNPITGSWMLLRTRGRKSGLVREAPLGYALMDGNVYCCAGFGPRTQWLQNVQADPRVEVVLPHGAIAGVAEEVTDPDELLRGWRTYLRALGLLGPGLVCAADAPEEELREKTRNLPLVRVRPTGIGSGPADPGGWLWATIWVGAGAWLVARVLRGRGRGHGRDCCCGCACR